MRFAPVLLALALLFSACSGKKPCKLHSDCSETERCVKDECTVLCRTDRDCEGLGRCLSGECSIGGAGGGFATGAGGGSGGGGGGTIDSGVDSGIDAGPSDAGLDAGLPDAGFDAGPPGFDAGPEDAGFDAGPEDAGFDAGPEDAGFDAGVPDAGSGTGQYGDACLGAGDCVSGLCIGDSVSGLRMCTIACGTELSCEPGHACLPVQDASGIINICVPSDSGRSCPNGLGSTCVAGLCLLHPSDTSLSVCATPCESTRSCPLGFSCSLVNVGAQMQKVCSPVASLCSAQGVSNQCISRWCSSRPQTPSSGICTGSCTTADDCPTGWACGLDDDGPSSVVDRCQPIGIPCTVNGSGLNDCYSKTCAQGTPQGDYCTAFCMDSTLTAQPSRCPAGWQCTNAGTTADPLWVCEQP